MCRFRKDTKKRQAFVKNNRKIADNIGNLITYGFVMIIAIALLGAIAQLSMSLLLEVSRALGFSSLKEFFRVILFVMVFLFISCCIAAFLFGINSQDD